MFLFFLLLLFPTANSGLLGSFRSDGFAKNVISDAFPAQVSIHIDSAKLANDGSIVAAGSVLYPAGYSPTGEIIDGPGIVIPEDLSKDRLCAFVFRVTSNRQVAWAIRTAPTKSGKPVSLVLDDAGNIYVTGLTTGALENGVSSGEAPFLAKLDKNGESIVLVTHSNVGTYYTSIAWHRTAPGSIVLVSYATASHPVFSDTEHTPTKSGLVAVKVDAITLSILLLNPISVAENPSDADLVQDKYWDMKLSTNKDLMYVAVKRQMVANWVHSFTPTILAISSATLATELIRELPKDLQLSMKLSVGLTNVHASYVSRTHNREQVIIHKFNTNLDESNWENSESSIFQLPIVPDPTYFRKVASGVVDFFVSEDMTVVVLLHASELLVREGPNVEEHRKLSNGRPAVMVVSEGGVLSHVKQSTDAENWEPVALLLGESADALVVGTDFGDGLNPTINSRPLLSGLHREATVSQISPVHSPRVPEASPDRSKGGNQDCIGISSAINGHSIIEQVQAREDLRLQWHPLRRLEQLRRGRASTQMLCTEWKNGTAESSLCATPFHVVRWHGTLLYMKEFCELSRSCVSRMDEPFNFKGPCQNELKAHNFLSVTMHSARVGSISAHSLAAAECAAMATRPFRWVLSTL